ncbi:gfo/Idh/MocA family oxidoreductase [Corallococcus sp. AB030]|uniref:Gfo/Idh/MocA family protein n=1 Tax=Corallococcus TaxID=83461 RepID=UPI000EBD718B|nr:MULTISPECIES: Gfo/Idh/MocA family oxidoreductase [Corallococcus]NRD57985.1 Gfo/Idh/MocA family oxidoreductase [Corallococcus exiguus]RKI06071.1 gfo/Idh/MocA family oxidoreductase [Corallococcus sp. AB030]RUO93028.1 gfo/Idh/MocA family oxidoreductase [Corallococcus sp. AB018]
MMDDASRLWTRRRMLEATGGLLTASAWMPPVLAAAPQVKLPDTFAKTERERPGPPNPQPESERVGWAVVGLGHLSLEEILPAFGQMKRGRVVALVSGDRAKAQAIAKQYGVPDKGLYDYKSFDQLKDNPEVQAVYIVLPNSMHAEFTVRAAQAGKHVFCEKPMASTSAECQQMIDACKKADRKLGIAYRLQYEPHHRAVIQMARNKELGTLKLFTANNGQNQGEPNQWRHKKALAGGGALPDVGIYCLSAARYFSGEEPTEVQGFSQSTPNDPRFKEVEESFAFHLRFPSGFQAHCTSHYGAHETKDLRLMGTDGWASMDPGFAYSGLRLRVGMKSKTFPKADDTVERSFSQPSQFAREMDHFSRCVQENTVPHTPGEEGLADVRIIEALYRSAQEGKVVKLEAAKKLDAFRGPPPKEEG